MSDSSAQQPATSPVPRSIAEILNGVEPMEDLHQFLIEDLTPEEEDAFYQALEDA